MATTVNPWRVNQQGPQQVGNATLNSFGGNQTYTPPTTNPLNNLPQPQNYQDMYGGSPQLPNLDMSQFSDMFLPANEPQIPDYLGQMAGQFNNFQPLDLGANLGNLGDMFNGWNERASERGPQIPVNDVVSQQMQDQMLNSAIGANRAQRDTSMRNATNQLGSRGFTSESPALQATNNRLGLNEALANTQARVDIPLQAAKQNADYRLQAMGANQNQRALDSQNFTNIQNAMTGRISPLLQALVGLV